MSILLQAAHGWSFSVPSTVFNESLSVPEKMVYVTLCAYTSIEGTASPSYATLSAKSGVSKRSVINAIKRLEELGFIQKETRIVFDPKTETMKNTPNVYTLKTGGVVQEVHQGSAGGALGVVQEVHPKELKDLSSKDLKTLKEKDLKDKDIKTSCPDALDDVSISSIVDYLNEKAESKFRAETPQTVKLIKARWKEGYRFQDFVKVIDKKIAEWQNTERALYIRPKTLFGPNFDDYLNGLVAKSKPAYGNKSYAPGPLDEAKAEEFDRNNDRLNQLELERIRLEEENQ